MMTPAMRDAVKECTSGALVAKEALAYALAHGAEHAEADHLRLLMDTAAACGAAVDFLVRESPHHGSICRANAVICAACAADARAIGTPGLRRLAEQCERCAAACEVLAAAAEAREVINQNRVEPELYA